MKNIDRTKTVLAQKALHAQLIYDDISKRLGVQPTHKVEFIADADTEKELDKSGLWENPFSGALKFSLAKKRKAAVSKLFRPEVVPQTAATAAALALCAETAVEIGEARGDAHGDTEITSDIAFAGLQNIRPYIMNHTDKYTTKARAASAKREETALSETERYKTKDGKAVSVHAYSKNQRRKLLEALGEKKPEHKFTKGSRGRDRKRIAALISKLDAAEFVEKACACGVGVSVLQSRDEWHDSELGKAVCKMPLVGITETGKSDKLDLGKPTVRGPLSDIKILDMTQMTVGAAATRILAEYGANVLSVRRGKYIEQEQSMLELDGWAGKNAIDIDPTDPEWRNKLNALIARADVLVYAYRPGCLDSFGLAKSDIRAVNPKIIIADALCYSDTVNKTCAAKQSFAADLTGLSVRGGSEKSPSPLNGMPVGYITGYLLALGTLEAIKTRIVSGAFSDVTVSVARTAEYLHEAADLCATDTKPTSATTVVTDRHFVYSRIRMYAHSRALGLLGYPSPATFVSAYPDPGMNMGFVDCKTEF